MSIINNLVLLIIMNFYAKIKGLYSFEKLLIKKGYLRIMSNYKRY